MFSRLSEFNWAAFDPQGANTNTQIPDNIRALRSIDPDVRQAALAFLFGEGQDLGTVSAVTSHIIPFLLDLLTDNTVGKADLLGYLAIVAENLFLHHRQHDHITIIRYHLATYDALKAGIPIFIQLLTDPNEHIRIASINLLGTLSEDSDVIIPLLLAQFFKEQDEPVHVALLHAIKDLLYRCHGEYTDLHTQASSFFKKILTANYTNKIHTAAAYAAVECIRIYHWRYDQFFPEVSTLLMNAFFTAGRSVEQVESDEQFASLAAYNFFDDDDIDPAAAMLWDSYQTQVISALQADAYRADLVWNLARLRPEPLMHLLQHPNLTASQAHMIARSLLVHAFEQPEEQRWHSTTASAQRTLETYYVQHDLVSPVHPLGKTVLQSILNAPKVWERPTNMFSFFYGLPDTREGLQEVLELGKGERA